APTSHNLVGQELMALGRHDEAIAELQAAVDGYPPGRFFLGSELFNAGRHDEAIAELERFVHDEPRLPVVPAARILLGRAHASAGRWPQAVEQAQAVLAGSPDHAEAHGLAAEALAGQRAFEGATPHYRAFVAGRPQDAAGWNGLGIALMSSGRTAEA